MENPCQSVVQDKTMLEIPVAFAAGVALLTILSWVSLLANSLLMWAAPPPTFTCLLIELTDETSSVIMEVDQYWAYDYQKIKEHWEIHFHHELNGI